MTHPFLAAQSLADTVATLHHIRRLAATTKKSADQRAQLKAIHEAACEALERLEKSRGEGAHNLHRSAD